MTRILAVLLVALLSFGAAAGGSIVYQKTMKSKETQSAPPAVVVKKTESTEETGVELPMAVRPPSASPEEMVRFSLTMGKREEALKKREEEIRQERLRLKLAMEDLRTEQRELEGLEEQVRGKIQIAQDYVKNVNDKMQELDRQREAAKTELETYQKHQADVDQNEMANIKRMSTWFQAMEPTKSAEYLSELANDGEMDMAAQILGNLEEREASKVLAAIKEPGLVSQLIDRFKSRKIPEKKAP